VETEAAPVTTIILTGAPWTVAQGLKLLPKLDKAPKQIHIEAMITEVSQQDLSKLGIDWSDLGTGASFTIGEPLEQPVIVDPATGAITYGSPDPTLMRDLPIGRIMRTPIEWMGVVRALESKGRARILSKPSVTTLDGRQTALHAGNTYYYPVVIAQSTGGVITDTRELQVGVTLSVNPRVNDNGEITLTLAPSVASLLPPAFGGMPSVNERSVVTTVRVRDGATAVIAGLISDEERVTTTKVPFLGNVPILGELFKHREKSPSHTEVLIFVTPTIVKE
jgi:type II secretory pathway component GspD/PulD (secretin)